MKKFVDRDTLQSEIDDRIAKGKIVLYRTATMEVDGFIGWILFV